MLTTPHLSQTSVQRDAWVEIDLAAIEENIKVVKGWLAQETKLMAVVKADAYGHGACAVAPIMVATGVEWLGVASVDEGCQLRSCGIKLPILILSPCPSWAIATALENDLSFTITSSKHLEEIAGLTEKYKKECGVHLKIDTGMHRLGLASTEAKALVAEMKKMGRINFQGIMSHLAMAGDATATAKQNSRFKQVVEQICPDEKNPEKDKLRPLLHLASGEAARRFPDTHYDMVRVGLYLYGLEPERISDVVRPALSLRGRINQLKDIEAGESVGYGHTWKAERKTRLASIPIGYADGIDRRLSNKISGLCFGKVVAQVGLISMDQMLFDVSDVPQAQEGDVITLIGSDSSDDGKQGTNRLYLADWANILDTVTYELVSRLRIRLPRIYTRQKAGFAGRNS